MQGENIDSVEESEIVVTVGQRFEACTLQVTSSDVSTFQEVITTVYSSNKTTLSL